MNRLIAGEQPDTYAGNGFIVFHVNFGVPEEYEEGHLPGALFLDTNRLEDPADWNRRPADELHATLRSLGISANTTVVLYGRDTICQANEKWPARRAGQIAATRAALILAYAGVRDVRVLDGGYDRWVLEGNPTETVVRRPVAVASIGVEIPQRPDFIVDIGDAKAILAADDAALVSARTWREHTGRTSGYNYIGPAGRIAGIVWGNCGSDAYHMQHYCNVANTMRPPVPRDRGRLGASGHHRPQVGGVSLRHRLARSRDVVLRLPDGLAANRRLRRRLVRVERGSRQPDQGRGGRERGRGVGRR